MAYKKRDAKASKARTEGWYGYNTTFYSVAMDLIKWLAANRVVYNVDREGCVWSFRMWLSPAELVALQGFILTAGTTKSEER